MSELSHGERPGLPKEEYGEKFSGCADFIEPDLLVVGMRMRELAGSEGQYLHPGILGGEQPRVA